VRKIKIISLDKAGILSHYACMFMSSTQQTPQTSSSKRDDVRFLKVLSLKSLKLNDKPKKAKMKRYEQTIGLRAGIF